MLDPDAFAAHFHVAYHFVRMRAKAIPPRRNLLTHEAHDIGAGQADHAEMDQLRIQAPEEFGIAEDDIHGPFALEDGPVILHRIMSGQAGEQRVNP